jgi:hypothetical protein
MSFTKVEYRGLEVGKVGIGTAGGVVAIGATMLNFVGAGNTFAVSSDGTTVDISIAGGGGAGEILKETFNVSGTQSVFNITEGQFDEGFLEVYLNGVKLNQSDFTENPPTQFTLDVAAAAGDVVEIIGFKDRGTNTSVQADVTNLNATGIVTAGQFVGDGSRITGVIGLGTAIAHSTPVLGNIFYRNNTLSVGSTVTMDVPDAAESNVGYTHHSDLAVEDGADFIVADGDEFIADVLGIGTDTAPLTGTGGRVRADEFTNRAGNGAPSFPYGISLGGSSAINDEAPLSVSTTDPGFITYQHDQNVNDDTTLTGSTSTTIGTKRRSIIVAATKSLILGPDCELVINTPGI